MESIQVFFSWLTWFLFKMDLQTSPRKILFKGKILGGGFNFFKYFYPYLGKWSNLTSIFFRWVGSTTTHRILCTSCSPLQQQWPFDWLWLYLEDHPMTCKWLWSMVSRLVSPLSRVVMILQVGTMISLAFIDRAGLLSLLLSSPSSDVEKSKNPCCVCFSPVN